MPALIIFCKSSHCDPYVNAIAYSSAMHNFDTIIFAWFEVSQRVRTQVQDEIIARLRNLTDEHSECYNAAYRLLLSGRVLYEPIDRNTLDPFVSRHNYGSNYFDLTGLSKEDMIRICSVLLANGVKNLRFFQLLTFPPKMLHEMRLSTHRTDFVWLNVYEIADEFIGFFEQREGERLGISLLFAILFGIMGTVCIFFFGSPSWQEIPVIFSSLVGGIFSLSLPIVYFFSIRGRSKIRKLRRMLGGLTTR